MSKLTSIRKRIEAVESVLGFNIVLKSVEREEVTVKLADLEDLAGVGKPEGSA